MISAYVSQHPLDIQKIDNFQKPIFYKWKMRCISGAFRRKEILPSK